MTNSKNKLKGLKAWLLVFGLIVFAWACFTLGGLRMCELGGGTLMEDLRCVNTSALDLCRMPDGGIMQYEVMPHSYPEFNLSLIDGGELE